MKQSLIAITLVVIGVVGLFIPRMLARFRMAREIRRSLRSESRASTLDMGSVAMYHDALVAHAQCATIDSATWDDLDLNATFGALDRTESQVGRQHLYHLLRTPQRASHRLDSLERTTQRFATHPELAAGTRGGLSALAEPGAAQLVSLLFGELPARPTLWWLFPILTVCAFACLVLIAIWPKSVVFWVLVCVANICLQLYYRPRVRPFITAFQSLPALASVAESLASLDPNGVSPDTVILRRASVPLSPLRRATSWLLFEPGRANELASTLYEYLNLLFLFDLNAFVFSTQKVSVARPLLRELFEVVGRIDAAQSIARWRESLPHWSVPRFSAAKKSLHAHDLFHPLLARPVANTIGLDNVSALITGSNMAGKTTFMRTLGVNAILAQTLHTACASSWNAPFLSVRSSIGRADSLIDGKSHYLAEVESVHTLIAAKRDEGQHLFLLDEMFRGTNTAERIAAAYAVLAYLNEGDDIVVVATHDLELLPLLGSTFAVYHFRESITSDSLSFDFILRAGPSSARNAIALLSLMRYPEVIVSTALAVLDPPV